ncbi:MAG: hypothetical protein ABFR95_02735 [Actinomycetota bacterium]
MVQRPDLLRIGGVWLEEVYFAFQFDDTGIREGLGRVIQGLRRHHDDLTIADWMARPNAVLSGATPLRWVSVGGSTIQLAKAAANAGPVGGRRVKGQE